MKTRANKHFFLLIMVVILFNLSIPATIVKIPDILTNFNSLQKNDFKIFTQNIAQINKYMPENQTVSFITTVVPDAVFIEPKAIKDFYMTQYAITPRILENNFNNEYMIGIFDNLTDQKVLVPKEYKIFKTFPNNLILFKRGKHA